MINEGRKYHFKGKSSRFTPMMELLDEMPMVTYDSQISLEESAIEMLNQGKTLIAVILKEIDGKRCNGFHFFLRKHGDNICVYNPIDTFANNIVLSPELAFNSINTGTAILSTLCELHNWKLFVYDEKNVLNDAITFPDKNFSEKLCCEIIPEGKMYFYDENGKISHEAFIELDKALNNKLHYIDELIQSLGLENIQ